MGSFLSLLEAVLVLIVWGDGVDLGITLLKKRLIEPLIFQIDVCQEAVVLVSTAQA